MKEGADRGSGLFVRGLVVEVLVVCVWEWPSLAGRPNAQEVL